MLKKFLYTMMISSLMAFLISGCSEGSSSSSNSQEEGTSSESKDDEIVIAFAQGELVNAWRVTNQKDMENWAEELGVKLISTDANQDSSKQLTDLQSLLSQQPDVLIIAPIEARALVPAVEMANKANVPLIVIDRTIDAEPGEGMYKTEITQSHVIAGNILAEKTVELLTEKYGEPRGNVVHVQGMAGASPVIDANQGWDEVMANYPNIKEVATSDAGFTKAGGLQVMEDFLQRFPKGEIDVVRSDYSDMTMGALQAIENAGRDELLGYVVGQGGHYAAIEAVISGKIALEAQTPPYFGEITIKSALDIINGKDVPERKQVDIKLFDKNDIEFAKKYLDDIRSKDLEF